MKLAIDRDSLAKALSTVTRVIQAKPAIEVLGHVLVHAEADRITITGADLEMSMSATVEAKVSAGGAVTLPAVTLSDYVSKLPAGAEVSIASSEDGQRIALQSKRSRATLGTFNPIVFPATPPPDAEHGFEIEGATVSRLLASVEFAVEPTGAFLALSGVALQIVHGDDGPVLRASATDGKRFGRAWAPCPRSADGMPDVILSKRSAGEMKKICDAAGSDTVVVTMSSTQMMVSAGSATLITKLVEAVYPDLDRTLPKTFDKTLLADGTEFKAALGRSMIVADDRDRSTRFRFTANSMEIAARSIKDGDIVEVVDVEYEGPDFSIGFDGKFARDILGALDSDTVRISCGDPGTPTLWVSPADASREYVLMPLRL